MSWNHCSKTTRGHRPRLQKTRRLLDGLFNLVGNVYVDFDVAVIASASKHHVEGEGGHNNNQYDCHRGHTTTAVAVGHGLPPIDCRYASRPARPSWTPL